MIVQQVAITLKKSMTAIPVQKIFRRRFFFFQTGPWIEPAISMCQDYEVKVIILAMPSPWPVTWEVTVNYCLFSVEMGAKLT